MPSPYSTTNCLQLGDYFFYRVWQLMRSKCQRRTGTDFSLFSLTTAVWVNTQKYVMLCALLKLMMRAEPWWEASKWAMWHNSNSLCDWNVLYSILKMGYKWLNFGQHGSFISKNRRLKKQGSNLLSFDNSTKFMVIALWEKWWWIIWCKRCRQNFKISPLNAIVPLQLTSEVSLLWQEVISWVRPGALFSCFCFVSLPSLPPFLLPLPHQNIYEIKHPYIILIHRNSKKCN